MSLLIKNASWMVTPDKVFKNVNVYIEGGRIIEFKSQEADTVLNAEGHALLPGMINLHTHIPMNYMRGVAENLPLEEWLKKEVWPREKKIDGELVYLAAKLGITEAVRFGTTSFVDMYFHEGRVAEAAEELGIRAWLGEVAFDFQDKEKTEEAIKNTEQNIRNLRNKELITPIVSPHGTNTCSARLLRSMHSIAREGRLIFLTHLSETKIEKETVRKITGKTPLKFLESLRVVDENFIGAHGVWLSPGEMSLMGIRHASIAHCPTSNMKLGSGVAPTAKYLKKGINVGLGTDGQPSNNNLDMFREVKQAALLQKLKDVRFPAVEALRMGNSYGARALGFPGGRIDADRPADLVLMDIKQPHFEPLTTREQALNNIVFSASGADVKYTIVNGKIVYDGKTNHQETADKLKARMVRLGLSEDLSI